MRLRWIPRLLAAYLLVPGVARASSKIDWTSFDSVLSDCDVINVTVTPNGTVSSVVEFDLVAGPQVTWWKGIDVPDGLGKHKILEVQDLKRTASTFLPASTVTNGQSLEIMKAKALGVHTGMYLLGGLDALMPGDKVTFQWTQDSCADIQGWPIGNPIPDWIPPGKTVNVKAFFQNSGNSTWQPDTMEELADETGKNLWNVPPMPIPSPVGFFKTVEFDFPMTAPTTPGKYTFDFVVRQRGGMKTYPLTKTVTVSVTPPPPPGPQPTPTPAPQTTVPKVVGLTYEDAINALLKVNLDVGYVLDPDPFLAADKKLVVGQNPVPGAVVDEGSHVALSLTYLNPPPNGYSSLTLYNCGDVTYEIYKAAKDGWQHVGSVSPEWDDNGQLCPATGSPFQDNLDDQMINYYIALDPSWCLDPTNIACRAYEFYGLGDSSGPGWSNTLP